MSFIKEKFTMFPGVFWKTNIVNMKTIITIFTLSFFPVSFAKNLTAHTHGSVHLDLATEKNRILVFLKSPSDSFLGFEYKAKTKREKMIVSKAKKEWTDNLLSYLDSTVLQDCKITKSKWEQKFEGKRHSNIVAEAYIDCQNKLVGRVLNINFHERYKKIKTIRLKLIRENGTVANKKSRSAFKVKL